MQRFPVKHGQVSHLFERRPTELHAEGLLTAAPQSGQYSSFIATAVSTTSNDGFSNNDGFTLARSRNLVSCLHGIRARSAPYAAKASSTAFRWSRISRFSTSTPTPLPRYRMPMVKESL